MGFRYADRDALMLRICEIAARGPVEASLAACPDLPCVATVWKWRRQDPAFDARFRQAREWGRALSAEATHAGFIFNDLKALEIVERVRGGEHIGDLLRLPGFPNRPRYDSWRRQRPDFAEAIRHARRQRDLLRPTRRPRAFDQATADRIAALVNRGVPIQEVVRMPGMPGPKVLARWRREQPEFDAVIHFMRRGGALHRGRALEANNRSPELVSRICRRIAEGATIQQIVAQPDMPCVGTFYRWLNTDPDFRAAVTRARDAREEALLDAAQDLAERATGGTLKGAEGDIRRINGRIGRMKPRRVW